MTTRTALDLPRRDAALEAAGVPLCPSCSERDRVVLLAPARGIYDMRPRGRRRPFCLRCNYWLSMLAPPPGKHAADF